MTAIRSGGQVLVDQLLAHGTEHVFGVPGESYLPVLDAVYERRDQLRFFACRQEGGAAMMAEADGKLIVRSAQHADNDARCAAVGRNYRAPQRADHQSIRK